MAYRTYRSEFPDYDNDFNLLPGFSDSSWHNDVCPSMRIVIGEETYDHQHLGRVTTEYDVVIFCDYKDPERRECGGKMYTVQGPDNREETGERELLLETEDWEEVKALDLQNRFKNYKPEGESK